MTEKESTRDGLIYALTAYAWWGMMPIYFAQLRHVAPLELLGHRIVWSAVLLVILLVAMQRISLLVQALLAPRTLLLLLASTTLIAVNWFVYIYGVVSHQTLHASLGYYVNPLVSVLLGLIVFKEHLRPWQWAALGLATLGLVIYFAMEGTVPWITLTLAVSFGLYGLLRKVMPVDATTGLTAETLLLTPLAVAGMVWAGSIGVLSLGQTDGHTTFLLIFCGVMTTIPLLCFGLAARKLPLTILGLVQYLSPTIQFLCGVVFLGESFPLALQICFACTWVALVVFSIEGLLHQRSSRSAPAPDVERQPVVEGELIPTSEAR